MTIYRLESQREDGANWTPVLDEERQPLTFTGPSGKAKARNMAQLMIRWPSFYAIRVMRGAEVVAEVAKQGDVSDAIKPTDDWGWES